MKIPKIGDILVGFFGYDAHIADWYKVVGVTNSSVRLIGLADNRKYTGMGGIDWTSTPNENRRAGDTQTKRFTASADSYFVNTRLCRLYPWDGTPASCYNHH